MGDRETNVIAGADDRVSQLSLNASDEQSARLHPDGSARAEHVPRPTTPHSGAEDNVAPTLHIPQRPRYAPDASEKQDSHPQSTRSVLPGNEDCQNSPHNEDNLEPLLALSRPLANTFDGLDLRGGTRTAAEDRFDSLPTTMSLLEDDMCAKGAMDRIRASSGDDFSDLSPYDDYYSRALTLTQLGTSLLERYEDSGSLGYLEEGITALKVANQCLPENHPMKGPCVTLLGVSFIQRFGRLDNLVDLDEAITAQQQAVRLTVDHHPDKPTSLNDLGISLQIRFECLGDLVDLNEAIMVQQQAVRLTPDDHPEKPACLNNLGNSFQSRFERLGDLVDLNDAIAALEQAIRLTPNGHPDKLERLSGLGNSLQSRFERLGDLANLDEAITAQQQAVRLSPDGHPDKPGRLTNLGSSFLRRFERRGDLADLDEAITAHRQAVRLTPDNHPHKSACLNNLGYSFRRRFERLGDLANLDDAITALQQALRLAPDGRSEKPACLNNLGISFQCRFERLGDLVDLGEAIAAQQQAIRLTPDNHPDQAGHFNSLGNSFLRRFQRLGSLVDLDKAITAHQEAVHRTPDGHPHKPVCLSNLGNSFLRRFDRLGGLVDIDEAITTLQQAVCLAPDGHPDKPGCLNNLANSFQSRFECLGDLVNLDEAVTAQREAIRLTPDSHPDKPGRLNNLGNSFFRRFERLANLVDLDEAITVHQQAIRLTPYGHPKKPVYLNNLGSSFLRRFERLRNLVDLDEAITTQQHAIRLTPDSHPNKPKRLNNLGISFQSRFECLGTLVDLEEAITAKQQAIHLTLDGHPDKPACLNNIGISFRSRFERIGDPVDLDEAIKAQQQAICLTPDGHPNKAVYLSGLGTSFLARLGYRADDATFTQAISTFSQSAKSSSGPPSHRFMAASQWASLCFSANSHEALDAYLTLVNLLPRVVWLGRTVEQRYKDISRIGNAMADAVNAAIHFGEFNLALEWMEQVRSIVWGQILQLRTPLDDLRQRYPNDANELERISHALHSSGVTYLDHSVQSSDGVSQLLEEVAQTHRRLAEEYDGMLGRIRGLPGFSEFLQPVKFASLCNAATSGPVVIVNAHQARCDALILLPRSPQVSHVPLPGLRISAAQEMQLQLAGLIRGLDLIQRPCGPYREASVDFSEVLRWLWSHIVEPILSHLKLLGKPMGGEMPHITWCLTGLLNFLPLHAAGLYGIEGQPKIFNYVVSSYTPTLASLLTAKRRPRKRIQTTQLLTISQPATPGQSPLPGTVSEVEAIQALQDRSGRLVTWLNDREATVATVLHHMKKCDWLHLACHGVQDPVDPTDSAFLLFNGPLTLKEIMKQSFSHTELAVLSACQTAKGDSELPEEAIHLAAGMLMAGYGSVVGTMWSIGDDDAPIIAENFYKHLIEEAGRDGHRAAYALHFAVAHLRNIRGENNFACWVPFIHLGICSPRRPLSE